MAIQNWLPSWEPDVELDNFPAAARILGGATRRFIHSGFSSTIFNKRVALFQTQRVTDFGGGKYNIRCLFYERLRTVEEIIQSIVIRILDPWQIDTRSMAIEANIDIFPSFYDSTATVVSMPKEDEPFRGGHNIAIYNLDEDNLLFQHVWSGGYNMDSGAIPIEYLDRYLREAWFSRTRAGVNPEDTRGAGIMARATDVVTSDLFTPWILINQRGPCTTFFQWKKGVAEGIHYLQVIAVAESPGNKKVIVGWANGRQVGNLIEFEELYVWPRYRGQKIGTIVAADALMMARGYGATEGRWVELVDDHHANSLLRSSEIEWMQPSIPHWLRDAKWIPSEERPIHATTEWMDLFEMMFSLSTPAQRAANEATLREYRASVDKALDHPGSD